MIEYFHTDTAHRSLTKLEKEEPGCWIALFEPSVEEMTSIAERFGLDFDDVRAPLDPEEVSRIESDEDHTMFIIDTPIRDHTLESKNYKTIPFAIFETEQHVISVCAVYKVPLIARLKTRRNLAATSNIKAFTCEILMASSSAYFGALRMLNRRRIELAAVSDTPTRKELEELYTLDSSLVYLKTSLAGNDTIFERHQRRTVFSYDEEDRENFSDVVVENRQALETTKIYSEILDSTIDHFGLMMNHDLNKTMQLVATITLVFCIPTVVGGFFGMNVGAIPLADSTFGFPLIIGITAICMAIMLLVLKRLRWF